MSQTVSGLDLQSLALGLDLKLKICECDMSLQTVESEGSRRKKERKIEKTYGQKTALLT